MALAIAIACAGMVIAFLLGRALARPIYISRSVEQLSDRMDEAFLRVHEKLTEQKAQGTRPKSTKILCMAGMEEALIAMGFEDVAVIAGDD